MSRINEVVYKKYLLVVDSISNAYRFIECRETKFYFIDKNGVRYKKKPNPNWLACGSLGNGIFARKQYLYDLATEKAQNIINQGKERVLVSSFQSETILNLSE